MKLTFEQVKETIRKITLKQIEKTLVEAVLGFVLWTAILTPYVIFVTKLSLEQYLSWLIMEAIIVPPAAVVVVKITNWLTKRFN